MTEFLLFTLYAPIVSWGDIAVGEIRGSWDRPSRSAILGIVGAALGIERHREEEHAALSRVLRVAVCVHNSGTPLTDYHTAQTASDLTLKRMVFPTRRHLLASDSLETALSRRSYRQDAVSVIALWLVSDDIAETRTHDLVGIENALKYPHFPLFAGRKANVLGLPLGAHRVQADTLASAFRQHEAVPVALRDFHASLRNLHRGQQEVSHDPCEGFPSGLEPLRHEVRRDNVLSRKKWQFANRIVHVGVLGGES